MRSLLFVFLIACGGGGNKPATVSNQPSSTPPAVETSKPMVATAQPSCANVDDVRCAVDTMQYFSDRICACKDKTCGDTVNNDMTAWGTDMAKRADASRAAKPSETDVKRMTEIMTKYTECMTKLMMDAPPPADPCAGSPDPCGG
jgi:hypothetical protein